MLKIVFFVLIALSAGCKSTEAQAVYRKISAKEAFQMMSGETHYILLDVRTYGEFVERRIGGAILIPDNEIRERAEKELSDKDMIILIYCRSGIRSERASRILTGMGYTSVYDFGGISAWPYETVSGK